MPKRCRYRLEGIGEGLSALEKQAADDAFEGVTGSDGNVWRPEPESDNG
jgi:hypothetical protein